MAAVDALATAWLAAGCASEYELCGPTPEAVCRAGRCGQHPPPNLPASWRRRHRAFSGTGAAPKVVALMQATIVNVRR